MEEGRGNGGGCGLKLDLKGKEEGPRGWLEHTKNVGVIRPNRGNHQYLKRDCTESIGGAYFRGGIQKTSTRAVRDETKLKQKLHLGERGEVWKIRKRI